MEAAAPNKVDTETLRTNEKKWSKTLMDAGWNVIPNIIIEKQEALGLGPIDMNIIVHLSHYWWNKEDLPHPTVATIAKAIGVSERTVQKHVRTLEAANLLHREERRHTKNGSMANKYNFDGLIKAATPFAKEKIAEREKAKKDKQDRVQRKRPRLVHSSEG